MLKRIQPLLELKNVSIFTEIFNFFFVSCMSYFEISKQSALSFKEQIITLFILLKVSHNLHFFLLCGSCCASKAKNVSIESIFFIFALIVIS